MPQSNHDGTRTLTHTEYQQLLADSRHLARLLRAGVDNWDGYVGPDKNEDDEEGN